MIEILVVVTIIGILYGTAALTYSSLTRSSRDARRRADLEQIRAALEMYRSSETTANGQYPTFNASNCANLVTDITNFTNYLPIVPVDPKPGPPANFFYLCDSSPAGYTLYSTVESVDSASCGVDCGDGVPCEYAVGPYGKTCGP